MICIGAGFLRSVLIVDHDCIIMDLKKQTIIHSLGNTVYLLGLWFLTVITTRILGYSSTGVLTLAMSIGNVIATIQVFGARGYQSSDVSFNYSSKAYVVFRCISVIFGCLIGFVTCVILHYSLSVQIAILLFILVKSSESFSDALFGNDQRFGHLEYAGFSMLIRGVLLVVLFSIGVKVSNELNTSMLIVVLGGLALSLLVDLPLHNRTVEKGGTVSGSIIINLIKECFPLLITLLIPSVITALPRIVLERFFGDETLGYYGNVSAPALLLTSVAPTILLALLPSYGNFIKDHNFKRVKEFWVKTIVCVIAFVLLAAVGVLFLGKIVLSFVYTDAIIPYVHYLYYILAAMMFYIITMCNNTVLVALRKSWGLTLTTVIALVVCVILSFIVIKPWGILGAVIALGIPYAVSAVVQIIWILKICKTETSIAKVGNNDSKS